MNKRKVIAVLLAITSGIITYTITYAWLYQQMIMSQSVEMVLYKSLPLVSS